MFGTAGHKSTLYYKQEKQKLDKVSLLKSMKPAIKDDFLPKYLGLYSFLTWYQSNALICCRNFKYQVYLNESKQLAKLRECAFLTIL